MTYDGDGNLAYELDYNVDAVVDGRCIYFPTHGTKAERELYKKVCDGYGWVRGDYTLTEYLNDVTRENVEVLAEYGRNYCSVTVYTYGNERIAATTFNGYGYHFGCHDNGYHNIFNHYEKWHDRWQIKDRWHNNHGNRPRTAEATYNYSNADKFKATYGSYSSYHSGKYCGHKWKTAMSKIYYLYDGHGSVERVHGKDGSTFRLEYDTYGNLVAGIVEKWHVWYNDIFAHRTANIYAYSGERYNVISGLQFLRARWYDTETGRFISEDSYLGTQENPLSRNRYIYTHNNPVNYVDPSGHIPVEQTGMADITKTAWYRKHYSINIGENIGKIVENTKKEIEQKIEESIEESERKNCIITREELVNAGWNPEVATLEMVAELNRVLYEYGILSQESILHFLAQAAAETKWPQYGDALIEKYSGSLEEWFSDKDFHYETDRNGELYRRADGSIIYNNDAPATYNETVISPAEKGDGAKYRGAGYIHLTWKSTYYEFAQYMKENKGIDDPKIWTEGAEYLKENYAWESAAWYWTEYKHVNEKIDSGEISTVEEVTLLVNGGTNGLETRIEAYERMMKNISI